MSSLRSSPPDPSRPLTLESYAQDLTIARAALVEAMARADKLREKMLEVIEVSTKVVRENDALRAKLAAAESLNIKLFGAKGDGIQDESPVIEQAVAFQTLRAELTAARAKLAMTEAGWTADRDTLRAERDELRRKLFATNWNTLEGVIAERDELLGRVRAYGDFNTETYQQMMAERDDLRDKLSEQIDRGNEAEADVRILRAKLEHELSTVRPPEHANMELRAERDELRAKLAEFESVGPGNMGLIEKRHYDKLHNERDELRAKLELAQQAARNRPWPEAALAIERERDELRAKLEEARAVVGRVATERDELRAIVKIRDEMLAARDDHAICTKTYQQLEDERDELQSRLLKEVEIGAKVEAERDDLRAELEKMKLDRDQFADEADDLRAKLAQCEKDWDEEVTDAEAKLAEYERKNRQRAKDKATAKEYVEENERMRTERDDLRDKLSEQIDRGNEAEADVRILRAKLAAAEFIRDAMQRRFPELEAERDAALSRVRELECGYPGQKMERIAALEGALRGLKAHSPYCDSAGSCCNDYRAADEHARRCLEGLL